MSSETWELPMRLHALLLVIALYSCASPELEQSSTQEMTERAYKHAVTVGQTETDCRTAIGIEPALALVRYCRNVSSATRPPCNSRNSCQLIVEHIEKMCHAFPSDNDNPLPCRAGLPPPDWDHISKIPAL